TTEAVERLIKKNIVFAPGKAVNAGGVAVSGLEMSQNSMKLSWPKEEVDDKLNRIMKDIHSACVESGKTGNHVDYIKGANIAGFRKVADAMLELGF
ncbi:MAG: glutamate dehydrogenase, partial [Spirochaetia bacterium]|nr:glutamate dehydrogenase [Spirochaetia bacterium]